MAIRIGPLVEYGELCNTRDYSVTGFVKLKGREDPIRLRLTGNAGPDLMGWRIAFAPPAPEAVTWWEPEADPELAETLQAEQIGPTGTMTAASVVKVTACPPDELHTRCKAGEPPPFLEKPRLYVEWYSQNGRVVIEIADPRIERIEYVDIGGPAIDKSQPPEKDEEPDLSEGPSIAIVRRDDNSEIETWEGTAREYLEEREEEDPYGLFSDDLRHHLDRRSREADRAAWSEEARKEWEEMELLDDLIETSDGEPLISFLQSPGIYRPPDQLDDEEVEGALKGILMELALFGVALDVCEHFTPRDAYRLLVEELLPNQRAHPELRGTGWVTSFMTHEFCPECEAEADRHYEEFKRKHPELHGGLGDDAEEDPAE